MSRTERVTIHDGRGNAVTLEKPRNGGQVIVDFNGPLVCLKSVDHWGDVKEQLCMPIPMSAAQGATSTGSDGKGGCGCP